MATIMFAISSQAKLVTVNDSLLTDNQKMALNVDNNANMISKYAGVGKEVGIAVNDGLGALTTQASKFAETKLGMWTMVIITYKVIGRDVIKIFVGIPLFFVILFVLLWQFNAGYRTHRIRTKGTVLDGLLGRAEYTAVTPSGSEKDQAFWTLVLGMAIDIIILLVTLFA